MQKIRMMETGRPEMERNRETPAVGDLDDLDTEMESLKIQGQSGKRDARRP